MTCNINLNQPRPRNKHSSTFRFKTSIDKPLPLHRPSKRSEAFILQYQSPSEESVDVTARVDVPRRVLIVGEKSRRDETL